MKTIRKNSNRGQYYTYLYQGAKAHSVEEFYKKPSSRKKQADYECYQQCQAEHGWAYRIISGNSFNFTAAWLTSEGLRVETAYKSYIINNMLEHCFDLKYFRKYQQYRTDDEYKGLGGYTVYKQWNQGMGLLPIFRFYKKERIILINTALYNSSDERHLLVFMETQGLSGYDIKKVYYGYPVYYNNSFNLNLKS